MKNLFKDTFFMSLSMKEVALYYHEHRMAPLLIALSFFLMLPCVLLDVLLLPLVMLNNALAIILYKDNTP